jgi:hypothetical protein
MFLVVLIFGLFAVYFFVAEPWLRHLEPDPTEVVMGFGILSIGILGIVQVFLKARSLMWLGFANVSFWFLIYGVVFDFTRWRQGVAPSAHSVVHSLFVLGATLVFVALSYRSRKPSKALRAGAQKEAN